MTDYADLIKQTLTMEQVLRRYGFSTRSRTRRIPCPLHHGEKLNFAYKARTFKCYVCGAHGTVIDFVMQLFNIPFSDALRRLNDDFDLGYPIGQSVPSAAELEAVRKANEARAKRIGRETRLKQLCTAYDAAMDYYAALDIIVTHDAPQRPCDAISPQYEYALKHIDAAWDTVQDRAAAIRKFQMEER